MKKFLIGCGIAVVVVLVSLVGAGIFVTRWVQDRLPEMERLGDYERTLVERYGEAADWTPPLDGVYDLERLAIFVQIRQALRPRQERMALRFDELSDPGREPRKGLRGFIGGTREVVTVLGSGVELLVHADSLLIASDMGKGEYTHYNLLLLHGVLHTAIDPYLDALGATGEEGDAREAMRDMLQEYELEARRLLRAHATNALEEIERTVTGPESAPWIDLLRAARDDPRGVLPLTDPVPPGYEAAIAPWRSTLEDHRPESLGDLMAELPLVLRSENRNSGGVEIQF